MGICRPLSSDAMSLRPTIFRPERAGYQQVEQIGSSLVFLQILTVTFLYAARDPMATKLRAKDKILRNLWGLVLLTAGLVFHCNAETFRNPRHIPIPSNPLQVGTADFNGDGRPDFYYVDTSGLNVILANSDGSYATPQTTAIGPSAVSCRVADFN